MNSILYKILKQCPITFLLILSLIPRVYAGGLFYENGYAMYKNDYGEIAKDTWVWIDTNRDSIAECYRFDSYGHIVANYVDKYGRETNEYGQYIKNGKIIQKMLSNDKIINQFSPSNDSVISSQSVIFSFKPKTRIDKITGRNIEIFDQETIGTTDVNDDNVVYMKSFYNEITDLAPAETEPDSIIYVRGDKENVNNDNGEILLGKDIRKFISAKHKCAEEVPEVYIYGGDTWKDVLSLNGNGAAIKILLGKNNHIRFEVAHQSHAESDEDTEMGLEMYVDGVLFDTFDDFVDGVPQIVEEEFDSAKAVELKLNIAKGALDRRVYIRNGRLRKNKIDD